MNCASFVERHQRLLSKIDCDDIVSLKIDLFAAPSLKLGALLFSGWRHSLFPFVSLAVTVVASLFASVFVSRSTVFAPGEKSDSAF
jgi:hypothetical protein